MGRHKIPPIWTNMFMHLHKGLQVVMKSNSMGILILFVLESLIYTRISLSQGASYIVLQPQPVGSFSCHILVDVVVFPVWCYCYHAGYVFHHRCRSRQIFGGGKDFCPNFSNLARRNSKENDLQRKGTYLPKFPLTCPKSYKWKRDLKKSSALWCWVPFFVNQITYSDFAKVFTHFAQISTYFARILKDFGRIFTKSKVFGVRLHSRLPYQCLLPTY